MECLSWNKAQINWIQKLVFGPWNLLCSSNYTNSSKLNFFFGNIDDCWPSLTVVCFLLFVVYVSLHFIN
jgi:hypothetical protein